MESAVVVAAPLLPNALRSNKSRRGRERKAHLVTDFLGKGVLAMAGMANDQQPGLVPVFVKVRHPET